MGIIIGIIILCIMYAQTWVCSIYSNIRYFWALCSIDLCVCSSASTRLFWLQWSCSVIWYQHCDSSTLFFFLKIAEAIWGRFWVHINFWNISSKSVKYVTGILIEVALNLYIALGSMDILMMLILPVHEHGTCFHLFVSSLISSFSVL